MYLTATFNHLRALQTWAATTGAKLTLDAATLQLEVKYRNRYFEFFPLFIAKINGRIAHIPSLTAEATQFAGWRPYKPYLFELSSDKLLFKQHMVAANQRTPNWWSSGAEADVDFVMKRSMRSFGYELAGPFRTGSEFDPGPAEHGRGKMFAEQFVSGKILKVWFWGGRPFFAHCQSHASVSGDGTSTLEALLRRRIIENGGDWLSSEQAAVARSYCAYQQLTRDQVPAFGTEVRYDYRYGRGSATSGTAAVSDNCLPSVSEAVKAQFDAAGDVIHVALRTQFAAPVVYALDGILDGNDAVWWLEMNSNPVLPPEGYAKMFDDLFGY